MDEKSIATLLIALGVVIALVGAGIATGLLSWFGRLPGDLRFEGDNVKVYVPIVSMLLVSVVLSLVLAAISRLR